MRNASGPRCNSRRHRSALLWARKGRRWERQFDELGLLERSAGYALTGELAPPVHALALMPCAIATLATDAPAAALGQYLRLLRLAVLPPCQRFVASPSCPPKLRGHDRQRGRQLQGDAARRLPSRFGWLCHPARFSLSSQLLVPCIVSLAHLHAKSKPQIRSGGRKHRASSVAVARSPGSSTVDGKIQFDLGVLGCGRRSCESTFARGTATGKLFSPCTSQCHHPSRGPSAFPAPAPQLKRWASGRYCVRGRLPQHTAMPYNVLSAHRRRTPIFIRYALEVLVRRNARLSSTSSRPIQKPGDIIRGGRRLSKGSLVSQRYAR